MRLIRRLRGERAYSMVEMITVMLIMSIVMTGVTTVFIQGSNAELDMNNRFQIQGQARLGLDKLRRELHCASAVTNPATQSGSAVTSVTLTNPCINASASNVSWCAVTVSGKTALYRQLGAACGSASPAVRYIDSLASANVFTNQLQVDGTVSPAGTLASLYVKIAVKTGKANQLRTYTLCDRIVLRNSTRGFSPWVSGAGSYVTSPC